jgi:hypothetical protein
VDDARWLCAGASDDGGSSVAAGEGGGGGTEASRVPSGGTEHPDAVASAVANSVISA